MMKKDHFKEKLLLWPQAPFNAKYFTNAFLETLLATLIPLKSFVRYST